MRRKGVKKPAERERVKVELSILAAVVDNRRQLALPVELNKSRNRCRARDGNLTRRCQCTIQLIEELSRGPLPGKLNV